MSGRTPRTHLRKRPVRIQDEALQLVGEMREQVARARVELDEICAENNRCAAARATLSAALPQRALTTCCSSRFVLSMHCPRKQIEKGMPLQGGGDQLPAAQDGAL